MRKLTFQNHLINTLREIRCGSGMHTNHALGQAEGYPEDLDGHPLLPLFSRFLFGCLPPDVRVWVSVCGSELVSDIVIGREGGGGGERDVTDVSLSRHLFRCFPYLGPSRRAFPFRCIERSSWCCCPQCETLPKNLWPRELHSSCFTDLVRTSIHHEHDPHKDLESFLQK